MCVDALDALTNALLLCDVVALFAGVVFAEMNCPIVQSKTGVRGVSSVAFDARVGLFAGVLALLVHSESSFRGARILALVACERFQAQVNAAHVHLQLFFSCSRVVTQIADVQPLATMNRTLMRVEVAFLIAAIGALVAGVRLFSGVHSDVDDEKGRRVECLLANLASMSVGIGQSRRRRLKWCYD